MDYNLPPEIYESLLQPQSAYEATVPDELSQLYDLRSALSEEDKERAAQGKVTGLRLGSIRQEALRQGTLTALHWRYDQIESRLETMAGTLDTVFNFRPFIEEGRVLSPAVAKTESIQSQSGEGVTEAAVSFTITEEARLITVAPTYRDYLFHHFEEPDSPHPVLLPKDKKEEVIWHEGVTQGWALGIEQANEIFEDSVYRLQSSIAGRITYRSLVATGYIKPAALEVTEMGVTYNGRTMNVGESFYEIKTDAQYQPVTEWRGVWETPGQK